MAAWDRDELTETSSGPQCAHRGPDVLADQEAETNEPLFNGFDAKRFDGRPDKLEDLGSGAFGSVGKARCGAAFWPLDHCHVVKLVATYAARSLSSASSSGPPLSAAWASRSTTSSPLGSARAAATTLPRGVTPCLLPPDEPEGDVDADANARLLDFLLGCVAGAMSRCHANGVRHLDIKPSNSLLNPYRVCLADFGISRDVSGQDQATTDGVPGTEKWRAPELYDDHDSSMQLSDMHSLGLVFLNIATVLYNARLADF